MDKIEKLNSAKESMNEMFDRKINEVMLNETVESIQRIPIMSCRDVFMSTLPKLYENKDGRILIKKYFNVLKENRKLASVFIVLEGMRNSGHYLTDVDLAISEYRKLCEGMDRKNIQKAFQEYRNVVTEAVKFTKLTNEELKNTIEKNGVINEALDYVLFENTTARNIPEYTRQYAIVKENLEKKNKEIEDSKKATLIGGCNIDESFSQLQKLVEGKNLSKWEKDAFDTVVNSRLSGKMKNAFNECRTECICLINETIEENSDNEAMISKMNIMKEQLDKKVYSEETFVTDILKLKELKNTLES